MQKIQQRLHINREELKHHQQAKDCIKNQAMQLNKCVCLNTVDFIVKTKPTKVAYKIQSTILVPRYMLKLLISIPVSLCFYSAFYGKVLSQKIHKNGESRDSFTVSFPTQQSRI